MHSETWQRYGAFLRAQAEEARLGARDIEQAFKKAALRKPGCGIDGMAYSKSHIDRLYSGRTTPKPPVPFTIQFLRITNKAAHLTEQEHKRRCDEALSLLRAATSPPRPADGGGDTTALRHQRDLALAQRDLARVERDLASAADTESRLRYALRDAEFLLLTLFQITGALREIIAGNDVRALRTTDPHALARVRDETRQAEAYKSTAQQEADRVIARKLTLEQLWDRARADLQRLAQHPDVSELTLTHPDPGHPHGPMPPADLFARQALDDIAAALTKAHQVNTRKEEEVRELRNTLIGGEGFLEPDYELAVLLSSARLTHPDSRQSAIAKLATDWHHDEDARGTVIRLASDPDAAVRQHAAKGLAAGWSGDPDAREAMLRLTSDADSRVRRTAAHGLGVGWSGDPLARDTVLRMAGDPSPPVRDSVANALMNGWPGDPTARDILLLLASDPDEDVRAEVAQALVRGWSGDSTARAAVLRMLGDTEPEVRWYVAEKIAASWPGDRTARSAVLRLSDDPSPYVRLFTAGALAAGWPGDAVVRGTVVRLTYDVDDAVKAAAATALGAGSPGDPAAEKALRRLVAEGDPSVQFAAEAALGNRGGTGTAGSTA
ncbi:HEAT repeat domain-containing protein [Streptomyces sp. NPDC048352]|uniref:HEAT repeat domain-containing protein n=1 Tax=Streptomyces sp. NPDC048352 TaxID=3154718 RepID=UPI00343E58E2